MCVAPKAHITSKVKKCNPQYMPWYHKKVQPPLIYAIPTNLHAVCGHTAGPNYWLTHHKQRAACTQNKAVCVQDCMDQMTS